MTELPARHLVVGRLRKPHGLKGECAIFPLTDDPQTVFAPGRSVWVTSLAGEQVAGPLEIERSRIYHREVLLTFVGYEERVAIEGWRDHLLSAPADTLTPPAEGEVYLHELEGFAVQDPAGNPLGVVTSVEEYPTGVMLEVQGKKREFLVPFRKEFVVLVEREARRLVLDAPEGLIDE